MSFSIMDILQRGVQRKSVRNEHALPQTALASAANSTTNSGTAYPDAASGTDTVNPYLNARRAWNEHVGTMVSAKQTWQIIGLISLMITLAAVGGVIFVSSQSKFIPYIVEVDKLGQISAAGPMTATTSYDPRVMRAFLGRFIADWRMVSPDASVQRTAVLEIYNHLTGDTPGAVKLNEFYNDEKLNPFKRAEKTMVTADIRTILQDPNGSWVIEWKETVRDRDGTTTAITHWKAILAVFVANSSDSLTAEQMQRNPLGIYIKDISWSQIR